MAVTRPVICRKRDGNNRAWHDLALDDPRTDHDLAEADDRDLRRIDNPIERFDPALPRLETVIVASEISELRMRPVRTR